MPLNYLSTHCFSSQICKIYSIHNDSTFKAKEGGCTTTEWHTRLWSLFCGLYCWSLLWFIFSFSSIINYFNQDKLRVYIFVSMFIWWDYCTFPKNASSSWVHTSSYWVSYGYYIWCLCYYRLLAFMIAFEDCGEWYHWSCAIVDVTVFPETGSATNVHSSSLYLL